MFFHDLTELMKDIALSMNQINHFDWKTPSEILNTEDINYPAIVFETDPIINVTEALEEYTLAFYILDRNFEDVSQRLKVLSKTKQLGLMFLQQLNRDHYDLLPVPNTFSILPLIDDFADRVTGWRFEFRVETDVQWVECDLLDIFSGEQSDPENYQPGEYGDDNEEV